MASMEDLYQEIILDHNKRPRHFGPLSGATHRAEGRNPLCGDEVQVSLRVEEERIAEIRFQGQGCAISRASASLMTEALNDKKTREAVTCAREVLESLEGKGPVLAMKFRGDLVALDGVRRFPARLKCASLPWQAVLKALADEG